MHLRPSDCHPAGQSRISRSRLLADFPSLQPSRAPKRPTGRPSSLALDLTHAIARDTLPRYSTWPLPGPMDQGGLPAGGAGSYRAFSMVPNPGRQSPRRLSGGQAAWGQVALPLSRSKHIAGQGSCDGPDGGGAEGTRGGSRTTVSHHSLTTATDGWHRERRDDKQPGLALGGRRSTVRCLALPASSLPRSVQDILAVYRPRPPRPLFSPFLLSSHRPFFYSLSTTTFALHTPVSFFSRPKVIRFLCANHTLISTTQFHRFS
ncbi:hypothetical protein B0T11DRAFT_101299 [Plectosphaerella cucumerina]|uniref:Uncharacterized protein n=1 Tax=Plectosphaerella cucumerina TaxID=40658 RepID=A0A8K0X1G7_9PEZI|nr:hypothetical protein B0T11DRAFT_101299 [Plectosphaerella cucumerina]